MRVCKWGYVRLSNEINGGRRWSDELFTHHEGRYAHILAYLREVVFLNQNVNVSNESMWDESAPEGSCTLPRSTDKGSTKSRRGRGISHMWRSNIGDTPPKGFDRKDVPILSTEEERIHL